MELYMSNPGQEKANIKKIIGDLNHEDLIGSNGVSKNGLIRLVENILQEIMGKEKSEFLSDSMIDKSNGSYKRTLNTSLGKLNIDVLRVRSGDFRSSLLPQKYQRYDESFEELIFTFLINGDSKNEIVYKMKQRGISLSEKPMMRYLNI